MTLTNGLRVTLNRHQVFIQAYGNPGDPIVLLLHHGLGAIGSWRDTIPALVNAGYYTLAYDRWGYGNSDRRSSISMPFFSEDLDDLADLYGVLGIDQAALVGHSDGGTIAMYFSAKYPEKVNALVTIAAHIYVEEKMETGIEVLRRTFERDDRFRSGLARLHGEKVDSVFSNWYDGWRKQENLNWDIRPVLRRIECPTLVIQGWEDEYATAQHAKDIAAAIPEAELWLAPEANHMLPQEMSILFNQKLLTFLGENHRERIE